MIIYKLNTIQQDYTLDVSQPQPLVVDITSVDCIKVDKKHSLLFTRGKEEFIFQWTKRKQNHSRLLWYLRQDKSILKGDNGVIATIYKDLENRKYLMEIKEAPWHL